MTTNIPFGEFTALAAAFIWAGSASAFRRYGVGSHPLSVALLRCAVATFALAITLLLFGIELPNDLRQILLLGLSGVIGISIADTMYYVSLFAIGTQFSSALLVLCPAVTTVIAWVVLGETLSGSQILGMCITTLAIGAIILSQARVSRGANAEISKGNWIRGTAFGVLSAIVSGVAMVVFREGIVGVNPVAGAFLRMAPATLGLILAEKVIPRAVGIRAILLDVTIRGPLIWNSLLGTFLGFILATTGMRFASSAGIASMLMYSWPIWVIPISHFVTREEVDRKAAMLTLFAVFGICLLLL